MCCIALQLKNNDSDSENNCDNDDYISKHKHNDIVNSSNKRKTETIEAAVNAM